MAHFLKKFFANRAALAVAAITLTGALTYASGIPSLGYYHDDWYMLWSAAARGPNSLVLLFSTDRPFMGWLYAATYHVLGDSLLGWHLYALAWRIAGAAAFYWILQLVWPKLRTTLALAAILFIVYPGFLSIPNAATKVNHLTGFGAALFSIAFTLQAMKAEKRAWKWALTILSLLAAAFYLWIYEYMIGLEVLRILLMFWMIWQGRPKQAVTAAKKVLWLYVPYLAVVAIFLFWRIYIFDSTRVATDLEGMIASYQASPLTLSLRLISQTAKDFLSTTLFAWAVQPYRLLGLAPNSEIARAVLLAAGAALLVTGYLRAARGKPKRGRAEEDADREYANPYVFLVIGALVTLATVFPVVATIRHLDLMDAYKSYGLHPSPGVMLLVIGLAAMLKPRFRNVLLIGLIAFSVMVQSLNGQDWARKWEIQRGFWWQLTWRAPDLKDDTLLMAYAPLGYGFQQDYEVWGPVNLIYRPGRATAPSIHSEVLNTDTALNVFLGDVRLFAVRDIIMTRDFRNYLLASQPDANACVHFIDGNMPVYSSNEGLIVQQVGGYSSVGQIVTSGTAPAPPQAVFGQEPERGWCYYYQKASLARQMGDWQRIVELYEAAAANGLEAGNDAEYFVFLEGLVNTGRIEQAQGIMEKGFELAQMHSFCDSLANAPDYPASFGYRLAAMQQLLCGGNGND